MARTPATEPRISFLNVVTLLFSVCVYRLRLAAACSYVERHTAKTRVGA
jgi:hypothetical protein